MDDLNIWELILTQDSNSFGKVSLTCKTWDNITCLYRYEEKMMYIKDISLMFQDTHIQKLDYEMYRCGTGLKDGNTQLDLSRQDSTSGISSGFFFSWREHTDDWEDAWYMARKLRFFS